MFTRLRSPVVVPALLVSLFVLTAIHAETPSVKKLAGVAPLAPAAIEHHIAVLAGDALEGREAGTEGCERAEQYIRDVLVAAGLDAVEEQEFPFTAGTRLGEGNALAIGDTEMPPQAFRPLAFSAPAEASWPAVFAGYGIEAPDLDHNDYAKIDIKGRCVVVMSDSPDGDNPHGKFAEHAGLRTKALTAASRGATALLVIVPGKDRELPPFRGGNVSASVGIPVVAVRADPAASLLGIRVKRVLKKLDSHVHRSRELGKSVRMRTRVLPIRRETRNILGWLRSRNPAARDEVVIIGAHHDHLGRGIAGSLAHDRQGEVHNGADDNASGVAGILELARKLRPRAAELNRHVLFMTLGGEEWGLLGSKYFKDHPLLRLPAVITGEEVPLKPVAMINMDMIGRMRERRLMAFGLATSPVWPELLESLRKKRNDPLELSKDREKDLVGSSDHISFYQLGIPVVFFFTGNHQQYHTPEDDLYRPLENGEMERQINITGMVEILDYIGDVLVALCNREEPPPLNEGVELAPKMQFRVVLRLLPDYGADVDGMRVSSVREGGPAARGGLRAGDVIVRFGEIPVHSVRDYMVGLQKAKAGEPTEVEVLREGKKEVLRVTPQGLPK